MRVVKVLKEEVVVLIINPIAFDLIVEAATVLAHLWISYWLSVPRVLHLLELCIRQPVDVHPAVGFVTPHFLST